MSDFYVLKRGSAYYADGGFTQDDEVFADKLRLGQAKRIKQRFDLYRNAYNPLPEIEIIPIGKDGE